MFRESKIMKTLRYLLITFTVMMSVQIANATAQSLATEPQYGFQSTSSMAGSGSTLPQAAVEGSFTTYDESNATVPAHEQAIRKGGRPDDWDNPYEDPIGEGAWILVALACCYAAFAAWRKRAQVAARR